jgi:hypothetical protein
MTRDEKSKAPFPLNPYAVTQWLRPFTAFNELITMTRKLEVMVFDFVQGITVDSQNGRIFYN